MKFTVDRAVLLKALAHVQSVVERRNTIPILANVMIAADAAGSLELTATDMEIAIVERLPAAAVARPGRTTVPAATLYEIVRKLPDSAKVELDLAGESGSVAIRAGRFNGKLNALPVDDFPAMTGGDLPHRFTLPAGSLRDLIDRTRFAISTEETRYYLNGIYLHVTPGESGHLRAVATDGHRLARVEMTAPEGSTGMPGVIVPRKTVAELRKLAEEANDPVEIELSETKIRFTIGPVQLTSKLIDGTFPEYERVIPKGNDKVMAVDRKTFADAVARVATISSERSRPVKLSLSRNLLMLTATSPEQGDLQEELDGDVVTYDATELEIGFQARYLTDITDQIRDQVRFSFADGSAPTIVEDGGTAVEGAPQALYVLMPMRV